MQFLHGQQRIGRIKGPKIVRILLTQACRMDYIAIYPPVPNWVRGVGGSHFGNCFGGIPHRRVEQ
jgi:hypothetical protein